MARAAALGAEVNVPGRGALKDVDLGAPSTSEAVGEEDVEGSADQAPAESHTDDALTTLTSIQDKRREEVIFFGFCVCACVSLCLCLCVCF